MEPVAKNQIVIREIGTFCRSASLTKTRFWFFVYSRDLTENHGNVLLVRKYSAGWASQSGWASALQIATW